MTISGELSAKFHLKSKAFLSRDSKRLKVLEHPFLRIPLSQSLHLAGEVSVVVQLLLVPPQLSKNLLVASIQV